MLPIGRVANAGSTPRFRISLGAHLRQNRPALVIGFAAETDDLIANAEKKLKKKGADWILANDVSPETGVMGGDRNTVRLLTASGIEEWPTLDKGEVAKRLVGRIASALGSMAKT